jgi:hypothetical protein
MRKIELPVGGMVFSGIACGPADGELVLLLHGFPQTSLAWGSADPYLARSTALATRGHVTGRYTETELRDVGHWLPELAPEAVTGLLQAHLGG